MVHKTRAVEIPGMMRNGFRLVRSLHCRRGCCSKARCTRLDCCTATCDLATKDALQPSSGLVVWKKDPRQCAKVGRADLVQGHMGQQYRPFPWICAVGARVCIISLRPRRSLLYAISPMLPAHHPFALIESRMEPRPVSINVLLMLFPLWIHIMLGSVSLISAYSKTALESPTPPSITPNMTPQCVDTIQHPEWGRAANPINTDWCRGAESELFESVRENIGTIYTFYSRKHLPGPSRTPHGWQLPDGAKYGEWHLHQIGCFITMQLIDEFMAQIAVFS